MCNSSHMAWRMRAAEMVFSQSFETCMGLIIVSNLVLIMYEANQDARCYPAYFGQFHQCPDRSDAEPLLVAFNIILLAVYSIECLLRAYVERGALISDFCFLFKPVDVVPSLHSDIFYLVQCLKCKRKSKTAVVDPFVSLVEKQTYFFWLEPDKSSNPVAFFCQRDAHARIRQSLPQNPNPDILKASCGCFFVNIFMGIPLQFGRSRRLPMEQVESH